MGILYGFGWQAVTAKGKRIRKQNLPTVKNEACEGIIKA